MRERIVSLIVRTLPGKSVDGIRVVSLANRADSDLAMSQIPEALFVVRDASPPVYRRIKRYVRQILVWPASYSAALRPGTVQLSTAHLSIEDPLELASVLVHEATHLLINAWRVDSKRNADRVERLCVKEQTEVLRKCGPVGLVMADMFDQRLGDPWWTNEARAKITDESLRDLGLPGWLQRLFGTRD
jgi:hypothetical protein